MRIAMASVIILDLGIRITDLEAFYSDTGAVPLSLLYEHAWNPYYISIHTMSGLWQVQLLLFLFSFFCAIMLLIGFRTGLFTFLSWFMMLSMHNRNELILQGGDDLLRMTLFWCMFLPWGARYSLDNLTRPVSSQVPLQVRSWASIAYFLQLTYIYTGSALLKGSEWHTDYTALYYVYSLDQISYPISKYLYYSPPLMRVLTAIAYYFELLIPLLFFIPARHQAFRFIAFILITGFHLFNGATIFIGLFFIIGIVTAVGILPSFAMDRFDRMVSAIRMQAEKRFARFIYALRLASQPYRKQRDFKVLGIFLVFYVLYWNISNLSYMRWKMGDSIRFIGYTLRLDQAWGMFAPGVLKDDGWFIYEAETETGRCIDLQHPGEESCIRKPGNIVSLYKNDRWRKYGENFILSDHALIRGYFCNYFRRVWNEAHPSEKIKCLRVIFMYEFTRPRYQYYIPDREVLFECNE